jgi:hypothetical protein
MSQDQGREGREGRQPADPPLVHRPDGYHLRLGRAVLVLRPVPGFASPALASEMIVEVRGTPAAGAALAAVLTAGTLSRLACVELGALLVALAARMETPPEVPATTCSAQLPAGLGGVDLCDHAARMVDRAHRLAGRSAVMTMLRHFLERASDELVQMLLPVLVGFAEDEQDTTLRCAAAAAVEQMGGMLQLAPDPPLVGPFGFPISPN